MGDDWFGHRDWFTEAPTGDKDEWTDWDYALARAQQLIEDYTDQHGNLVYEVQDDRVVVEAVRKIDKFEAAKDRITSKKNYKPLDGEYYVPRLEKRSAEWPTFEEWVADQAGQGEKEKILQPDEAPEPSFVQ